MRHYTLWKLWRYSDRSKIKNPFYFCLRLYLLLNVTLLRTLVCDSFSADSLLESFLVILTAVSAAVQCGGIGEFTVAFRFAPAIGTWRGTGRANWRDAQSSSGPSHLMLSVCIIFVYRRDISLLSTRHLESVVLLESSRKG